MTRTTQPKILFYPQKPNKNSVIYKIIKKLQIGVTIKIEDDFEYAINWEDTTYRRTFTELERLSSEMSVLNLDCKNISKEYIDLNFEKIFGYSLNIDPTKFDGLCLRKSNFNAVKDGKIIECPCVRVKDQVYQLLINNIVDRIEAEDIRVPIFNGFIPIVFLKYRPLDKRFSDDFERSVIENPDLIFSKPEIEKILRFCENIGLDYGELDILRDRNNGRIYIVDANNTPWGPPDELTVEQTNLVLEIFAQAFYQNYIVKDIPF